HIWYLAGGGITQIVTPAGHEGFEWRLDGVADLTGDHTADLVWANNSGSTHIWQVNGTQVTVLPGTGPTAASPSAGLAAEPGFTAVPVADGDLILTAQPGPETFDFSSWSFGHDSIQNFAPGEDVIRLNQSLSGDFARYLVHWRRDPDQHRSVAFADARSCVVSSRQTSALSSLTIIRCVAWQANCSVA